MSLVQAISSDFWVQIAFGLFLFGLVLAVSRRPINPVSRKRAIAVLWAVCLGVLGIWIMRQQALVLSGGHFFSAEQYVAVPIKGTVRYVTQELAYRHSSSMWVLLIFGLGFAALYKIARVGPEA
jgi:hypothetical protein